MTTARRDGNESPFSQWIRAEPKLDSIRERLYICDADYWIHQYRAHRDRIGERMIDSIMLIELKTFSSGLPFNQRDTLKLINEGFRRAFSDGDGKIKTLRFTFGSEVRLVRIYGAFLLRLNTDRPDTSNVIEWHGRKIDLDTLIEILSYRRDPRTLRPRGERRHHMPSARQAHHDLFVVSGTD